MLAAVRSATLFGVEGRVVTVEVHASTGLPGFQVVGMPDEACRESRDRVRAAVLSSGLAWPQSRITVNLAPSGLRKVGAGFDLPIAIGVLAAHGSLGADALDGHCFLGELGLDGSLRAVAGVAPMVAALDAAVPCTAVVPMASRHEAAGVAGDRVRAASTLREVVDALTGETAWPPAIDTDDDPGCEAPPPDLADVRGQPMARLAMEVAAAGHHHLLFVGPPGAGKTMLAQRVTGLLPELDTPAALEATMVHSAAGVRLPRGGLVRRAPFRAPHHSSSMVSLVGGGGVALRPGEVSLASHGVLFLDELGEFPPSVLDSLRQPLEEGVIRVARAHVHATLPARFLLVAATNPCPCGGGPPGACVCDETARARYLRRLSGPLLDRFDLRVGVARPEVDDLLAAGGGEPTATVALRVARARRRAVQRAGVLNGHLAGAQLDTDAPVDAGARRYLRAALEAGRLTGRGYHRVRRVARTLADLDGATVDVVAEEHVVMAMSLRVRLGIGERVHP